MYALRKRLDLDIGLWVFKTILYNSGYSSSKTVHMVYGHILCTYLRTFDINVLAGDLTPQTDFDRIGLRQLSLSGFRLTHSGQIVPKRRHPSFHPPSPDHPDAPPAGVEIPDEGIPQSPFFDAPQSSMPPISSYDPFSRLRDDIFGRIDSLQRHVDLRFDGLSEQYQTLSEQYQTLSLQQRELSDFVHSRFDDDSTPPADD